MSESKYNQPYKHLGSRLKSMRVRLHESLAEVSGAVEIDPEVLSQIEQGQDRPSEDVLLLLFSYFDTKEEEALKLWELAGYDQQKMPNNANQPSDDSNAIKPIVMVVQQDNRILYSDSVNVNINQQGVVLNFLQNPTSDGQNTPIARIGMSRTQAERVLAILQQTLYHAGHVTRALPAPKKAQSSDDRSS